MANGKCIWYYLRWPEQKDKTECVLCRQHRCVQRVFGDRGNPAASGLHSCPCPSSPGSPSSQTPASFLSTNTQSSVSLRQTKNSTTPLAPRLSYSFHSPSQLASIPPLSGESTDRIPLPIHWSSLSAWQHHFLLEMSPPGRGLVWTLPTSPGSWKLAGPSSCLELGSHFLYTVSLGDLIHSSWNDSSFYLVWEFPIQFLEHQIFNCTSPRKLG